jgi:hypothetical protein
VSGKLEGVSVIEESLGDEDGILDAGAIVGALVTNGTGARVSTVGDPVGATVAIWLSLGDAVGVPDADPVVGAGVAPFGAIVAGAEVTIVTVGPLLGADVGESGLAIGLVHGDAVGVPAVGVVGAGVTTLVVGDGVVETVTSETPLIVCNTGSLDDSSIPTKSCWSAEDSKGKVASIMGVMEESEDTYCTVCV